MENKILKYIEKKNYISLKNYLNSIYANDLAEVLNDLDTIDASICFRLINKDKATLVFSLLDVTVASSLLEHFTLKESRSLIEEMSADDATDILEEMPANIVDKILKMCHASTRKDINKLLKYDNFTAGSIMTVEYAELKENKTIAESIDILEREIDEYETINTCFVVNKSRVLVGIIELKDLLFNDQNKKIKHVMNKNIKYVSTQTDQEEVAGLFKKYDCNVMPVVDSENRLVGIITVDDIVDVIEHEATEDMKKMAAIIPKDKPYSKMSVTEIFLARIPWLLLLMISATFTGKIIESYSSSLAKYTILTAFIPMIMDTAGNAGGQASVSIIRALSLKNIEFNDIFKVIFKESKVAILCAIVLGVLNFFKLMLIDTVKPLVALIVSITLMLTILLAKIIGGTLPMIAKKLKLDPAVMASPFITTIVDACSLLIYFKIASLFLEM